MPEKKSENETKKQTKFCEEDKKNRKCDKSGAANHSDAPDDLCDNDVMIFTPEEAIYFLSLYDDIIAREAEPEVVRKLYRCCRMIVAGNPGVLRIQASSLVDEDVTSDNSKSKEASSDTLENSDSCQIAKNDFTITLDNDEMVKLFAAQMVSTELDNFPNLLGYLLSKKDNDAFLRRLSLLVLSVILSTQGLHSRPGLANATLPLGDSPLIQAARARDYDVMLLLLKNGADVTKGWMSFECPLELLLFAPSQQSQQLDSNELLKCLHLMLAAMNSIPWDHLQQLQSLGYYPLITNWKELLLEGKERAWGTVAGPPSLNQLCRCVMKNVSDRSKYGTLTGCIPNLPIPNTLVRYLTLEDCDS